MMAEYLPPPELHAWRNFILRPDALAPTICNGMETALRGAQACDQNPTPARGKWTGL